MIRFVINRRRAYPEQREGINAPGAPDTEASGRYLLAGQGVRVRKRGRVVRAIGNILIIIGVVMLVGIGGWYGYTQWDNQRIKEELAARGGLVDPLLPVEKAPTPAPPHPPPRP